MKVSVEGKIVFEVGKIVVVGVKGKGFSHVIPGEKSIHVLPDLGIEQTDRTLVFLKDINICIQERETYVLVGPYSDSLPLVQAALYKEMRSEESAKKYADLSTMLGKVLESVPDNGAIATMVKKLEGAASALKGLDVNSAVVEAITAFQKHYPEQMAELLKYYTPEQTQMIKALFAEMGVKMNPSNQPAKA